MALLFGKFAGYHVHTGHFQVYFEAVKVWYRSMTLLPQMLWELEKRLRFLQQDAQRLSVKILLLVGFGFDSTACGVRI